MKNAPRSIEASRGNLFAALQNPEQCGFHFAVHRDPRRKKADLFVRASDGQPPPPLHIGEDDEPLGWERTHIKSSRLEWGLMLNLDGNGFKRIPVGRLREALAYWKDTLERNLHA